MNPEDVLLWVAFAASLATAGLRFRSLRTRGAEGPVDRLLPVSAIALALATAVMVLYFIAARVSIDYVFSYTSTGTPLPYRIAGLWGGQKGTLLIWATFSSVFLWIHGRSWRRLRETPEAPPGFTRVFAWSEALGALVTSGFIALLLLSGLFDRTDPYLLAARPTGLGLQPVLRTPFMLIHPPLQFVSYSFSTLLFSCAIAGVLARDRAWADLALPWARWGFVVATTGLGLGGLWAYYVLNFGGYWAWDPVETANLLAWFPLLLSVHALLYYRKRGMFAASAPLLAALTLVLDLFATIATRTGLWVSVHAFTDPSRNFTIDPLQRLLSILDTSVILQGLMAMLLGVLILALGAYVERMRSDAGGPSWGRRGATVALVVLAAGGVLTLLDVRFVLSAVFQTAQFVGFGHAPVGLGLLVFGGALVVALPTMGGEAEVAAPRRRWLDYVDTAHLVFLGMLLLSLAFLVLFLLQVLSVNGYTRSVYDERAPLVALPILLVLPAGLAHAWLGRRWTVGVAAGALVAGVLLAAAWPRHWHLLLVVPAFAWALVGTGWKLFKVSDPGPTADGRLRVAGGLLLLGGFLDLVYWANPPSRVALGFASWHPGVGWAPIGILVGLLGMLSSVGVLTTSTVRAHRYGGALVVLGVGFGIGAVMGLAALVLAESRRSAFPDRRSPKPMIACMAGLRRQIRKTGVYTMHFALVVGLLGYALSTYAQNPETDIMLRPGSPQTVHGYELRLVGAEAGPLDRDQGTLTSLSAVIEVWKGGHRLATSSLTMTLVVYHRYGEHVRVERFAGEDLYMHPLAFVTPERSFVAQEENVVVTSGHVDAVALTVKTLPGMHLLWGGLWGIVGGMMVNLVALGSPWEFARPKPADG